MTPPMNHEDPTLPVHAYLDGELDPANVLAMEKRMSTDPALAAVCERIDALQHLMRAHLPREAPPPGLRRRVEAVVGMQRPRAQLAPARYARTGFAQAQFSWRALAASIAVTAVVAGSSTSMFLAPSQSDLMRNGVVDAHIRALMAPQPIDVASSDRHTVKPWFNGRIPQAPRVVDLAKQGFPLAGGRIDVVGEVPVPTLVYAHAKHLISLTAVPDSGHADSAPVPSAVNGYNMYRWTEDGVAYWAVSDVAAADLDKLVTLFRSMPPDQ
jgi:anti-sigma factor RsiW